MKNFLNFDFNKCSDGVSDNQFAHSTPVAVGEWVVSAQLLSNKGLDNTPPLAEANQ